MRTGQVWLLIDSHNLIHADAGLRRLMTDPERARHELERLLAHRPRTVVVHDGGPHGLAQTLFRKGLQVIYAGSRPADDVIVAWIRHHAGQRVAVATADGALARRARTMGAAIVSPDEVLTDRRLQRDAPPDREPPATYEVEGWMRAFGLTSELQDRDPAAREPQAVARKETASPGQVSGTFPLHPRSKK